MAHTGVRSEFFRPIGSVVLPLCGCSILPDMSTTMTNLTPVLVSHPYMARRSSIACSSPKSCPTGLVGNRASKISRHVDNMKENSRRFRELCSSPSAGKSEMCNGLF